MTCSKARLRPNLLKVRRGWSVLQLLITVAIISVLAALFIGVLGNGRESSRRTQCDANLKTISMALGTYLEEHGQLPASISVLREKKYLPQSVALLCPNDPEIKGVGYDDYYMIRAPRDSNEYPIIVCPHHENHGDQGNQAFKGRYTKQLMTKPATMVSATNATVQSPGKSPMVAYAGMVIRGGDVVRTGPQGMAKIRFADDSSAELQGGSEVSVLQSYIDKQTSAPLYTLLGQKIGNVLHTVTPGSRYDVVTPVATAGAHGTQFLITVATSAGSTGAAPSTNGTITVTEGVVAVSTLQRSYVYRAGMDNIYPAVLNPEGPELAPVPTPVPTATPTPVPAATPTAAPTPTRPGDNRDGDKHDDD